MNDHEKTMNPPRPGGIRMILRRIIFPLLIIAAAVILFKVLIATKPEVKKRSRPPMQALVKAIPVSSVTTQVSIQAMGMVMPAREITLKSRISGEVLSTGPNFEDGAFVQADEELLRIDAIDYELAVQKAEAQLANAVYDHQLEAGRQKVAEKEWSLMEQPDDISQEELDLALRKPHLIRVAAQKKSAEAALKDAQLDLDRTVIRAPFSAVIKARHTDLGAQVGNQEPLAILTGTEKAWIRLNLPTDRLNWIVMGAQALISLPDGNRLPGTVSRMLPNVEEQGRMARVIVELGDPFSLLTPGAHQPLLMGSFVHVELAGITLSNVIPISRAHLHNAEEVWLARADNTLEIRPVETAWKNHATVLISSGLTEGERIITTGLSAPVEGMPIVVADEKQDVDAGE